MHNLGPTRYSHLLQSRQQFSQNAIRRYLNRFTKWLRQSATPDPTESNLTSLVELSQIHLEEESLRSLRQSLLDTFDVISLLLLFLKETQALELRTLNHSSALILPRSELSSRLNQPSSLLPSPGCKASPLHLPNGSGSLSRSSTVHSCQQLQPENSQWVSSLTGPRLRQVRKTMSK